MKAVGGSKAYTQGLGMRHVVALLKAAGFKVGRWFLKAGEISIRDGVWRGLIAVDGTSVFNLDRRGYLGATRKVTIGRYWR